MIKLENCPFCGSPPMVNIRERGVPRCDDSRVVIVCLKCSAFMIRRLVNTDNVQDIIEKWNRRV